MMRNFFFTLTIALLGIGLTACNTPLPSGQATSSAVAVQNPEQHQALKAELDQVAAEFSKDIKNGNWGDVVEIVPPRLLKSLAADAGFSYSEMKSTTVELMEEVMESGEVRILDFKFDTSNIRFNFDTLKSSGKTIDIVWTLVPTTSKASFKFPGLGRRTRSETETTWAVREDSVWYLVRSSNAMQIEKVKELYPFMKGVKFK